MRLTAAHATHFRHCEERVFERRGNLSSPSFVAGSPDLVPTASIQTTSKIFYVLAQSRSGFPALPADPVLVEFNRLVSNFQIPPYRRFDLIVLAVEL